MESICYAWAFKKPAGLTSDFVFSPRSKIVLEVAPVSTILFFTAVKRSLTWWRKNNIKDDSMLSTGKSTEMYLKTQDKFNCFSSVTHACVRSRV